MFVFNSTENIELCKECENLKKLAKTQYFPEQFFCAKHGISRQEFCEKTPLYKVLHQCDDCGLLGKKTDEHGVQYCTCLSPKNTKIFGNWVKAMTKHSYFKPNEICKDRITQTR